MPRLSRSLLRFVSPFRVLAIVGTAGLNVVAATADSADLQALRAQLHALERQLAALAQQIEAKEAAAVATTAPAVSVTDRGYSLASADTVNFIRLRGLLQGDWRQFVGDHGTATNAFVMRRIRIITEGTLAKNFGFQFVPEFGGSSVTIHEANLTVSLSQAFQFRFGRFKAPVGLERLQSDATTFFSERSIATNLTPDRDVGVQLFGDACEGRLSYALGVLNGIPDGGGSSNTDFDNDKDAVGRILVAPFRGQKDSALQGLWFGVGGSVGSQKGFAGRTTGYKTDGQQTFFAYDPLTVADGRVWRIAPQFDYRVGSFGLQGEYIVSAVTLRSFPGSLSRSLEHHAWQLATGYVLTGEPSSYYGVVPRTNFDPSTGTWGAFEIAARVAEVDIDDASFPAFASATQSASKATSLGIGLNWYLSKAAAFKFDYFHTDFDFRPVTSIAPATALLRRGEQVLITRVQLAF